MFHKTYKFEVKNYNEEYTKDNLDLFSRGLYDLINDNFSYGQTFALLAIARYTTESLIKVEEGMRILDLFGFIKEV